MQRNAVLVVLACTLIGVLAVIAWLVGQGILFVGDEVAAGRIEPEAPSTVQAGDPDTGEPFAANKASRRSLENADTGDAEKQAPDVILTGRCLDGTEPLAGIKVELRSYEDAASHALNLYRFRHPDMKWDDPPIVVRSGKDGRFELRLRTPPVYRGWLLKLGAAGRVRLQADFGGLTPGLHDLGDIQLRRGCLVTGAVRDRRGRPHPNVRVFFWRRVDRSQTVVESNNLELRTSADGSFRTPEVLAPAEWKVRVHSAQLLEEKPLLLDLTGKTSHDLQIRVRDFEEVDQITGTVVDEAGRPLVPATVRFEPTGDYRLTLWSGTEASGRFLVQRRSRDPRGRVTLIVTPRGKPEHRVPDVAWNTTDLRIVVPSPPELELVVRRAAGGKPVEHYGVMHQKRHPKYGFNSMGPLKHTEPHKGGRVRITGLASGRHRFTVVPRDPKLAWSEPQDVEVGKHSPAPLVVTLPPQGSRPVLVVDAGRQPVAGAKLKLLRGSFRERPQRLFVLDPLSGNTGSGPRLAILERESITDENGRLVLYGNPNQRYALWVMPPRHIPKLLWEVIPDARFGELRIQLDRGCTVRGRVHPVELWRLLRSRRPASAGSDDQENPELGFQVRSLNRKAMRRTSALAEPDRDGRFLISGLPPGGAELKMRWYRHHRDEPGQYRSEMTTVFRWAELPAGQPADVVVDLRRFYPVQVQGLVTLNGKPLPKARIALVVRRELGGTDKVIDGLQIETDAKGQFVCEVLTGRLTADWYPSDRGAMAHSLAQDPGTITIDTKTVDLAFASGALNLVLQRKDKTPVQGIHVSAWVKGKPARATQLPRSDAEGRTSMPHMPPGEYEISMWPKSLEEERIRSKVIGSDVQKALELRVHLGVVVVTKAGTMQHRLTLPAKAGY